MKLALVSAARHGSVMTGLLAKSYDGYHGSTLRLTAQLSRDPCGCAGGSVWSIPRLPSGVDHGSMQFPVRLLHARRRRSLATARRNFEL